MSLREKFAWAALITILLGVCGYATAVLLGSRHVIPYHQVLWSALMWLAIVTTELPISRPLQIVGLTTPLLLVLVGWSLSQLSNMRRNGFGD